MKKVVLSAREINSVLKKNEGWAVNAKKTQLYKTFKFKDYIASMLYPIFDVYVL